MNKRQLALLIIKIPLWILYAIGGASMALFITKTFTSIPDNWFIFSLISIAGMFAVRWMIRDGSDGPAWQRWSTKKFSDYQDQKADEKKDRHRIR